MRSALRSLSARAAEEVGGHLAAAAELLDDDPQTALAHARAARAHAARVAVVREAVGIAAYRAEEWTEALTELRAAHRMSGEYYLIPLLMDTERALGRPQAALKLAESLRGKRLDAATHVELAVVMAGVRRDLGSADAALAVLEREDLTRRREPELSVRLWYAYADALESAGRRDEAANWFGQAAGLDRDGVTDAADRAANLL
ncbi:hypothetical protein ACXR2U_09875 [Jatrophihabitans sp. YIM 134969]